MVTKLQNNTKLDNDNKLENNNKIRQWQQTGKGTSNWTMTTNLDKGNKVALNCRFFFRPA
jgi:hypothetical protein